MTGGMKHALLATLWVSEKSDDFPIKLVSYVRCCGESIHYPNINALQRTQHWHYQIEYDWFPNAWMP